MKTKIAAVLAGAAIMAGGITSCGFDPMNPKDSAIEALCRVIVVNVTGGTEEKAARAAAEAAVKAYGDSEDENTRKIVRAAKDSLDGAKPHTDKMRREGELLCLDAARN